MVNSKSSVLVARDCLAIQMHIAVWKTFSEYGVRNSLKSQPVNVTDSCHWCDRNKFFYCVSDLCYGHIEPFVSPNMASLMPRHLSIGFICRLEWPLLNGCEGLCVGGVHSLVNAHTKRSFLPQALWQTDKVIRKT